MLLEEDNQTAGATGTDQSNAGAGDTGTAGATGEAGTTAAPQPAPATAQGEASAASTSASSDASAQGSVEKGDLFDDTNELLAAIEAKTGEKVSKSYIESRIAKVAYAKLDETVTLCSITLDNGYSVRGESACVDPANYDEKIGKSLAYNQAFDKLWPLFGFRLAEARHLRSKTAA